MIDIDGLSTPSWRCVHFTGASNVSPELVAALGEKAIVLFSLKGEVVRTAADLFGELARAMAFPDYFGMNWDATEECLRDIGERRLANGYVLFVHDAEFPWRQAFAAMGQFVELWQSVAEELAQDDTSFHLVFVASGRPTMVA